MDIDTLLEELDRAELERNSKQTPSSSRQTSSPVTNKRAIESSHGSNGTDSENVAGLLKDLDDAVFSDTNDIFSSIAEKRETEAACEGNDIDKDIAAAKKESSSKYSGYGHEIHKKLKENRSTNNEFRIGGRSWKSKAAPEKSSQLAAPATVVTGKVDVLAEPIFGLRLINPLVSSQFIQSKMTGKQPVAVSNIAYHLQCGDRNTDWVFAGAVVFKSGLKTSQKGSQYCTWKISDLKGDLQTVSVYLFSKACSELWKVAIGTVVAILNATPFNKDEHVSKNDLTLTVRNEDQVMIWGGSRDYGICKAKKKNGDNCTSFVNKSACEFCVYHVKAEYNKFSNGRSNLVGTSGGINGLRNKVLGKSEVFYAGKSFSALKAPPRDNKVRKRDNQLLNRLPLQVPKKSALLSQFDSQKLEKLSKEPAEDRTESRNENVDIQNAVKRRETLVHVEVQNAAKRRGTPVHVDVQNTVKKHETPVLNEPVSNNSKKTFASRLHMLKEAGQRMVDTGKTTRVTLIEQAKKAGLSFATVFDSTETITPSATELESRVKKTVTRKECESPRVPPRKPSTANVDFELHVESAPSDRIFKKPKFTAGPKKSTALPSTSSPKNGVVGESKTKQSIRKTSDRSSDVELLIESPEAGKAMKFRHNLEATSRNSSPRTTERHSSTFLSKFKSLADTSKLTDCPSVQENGQTTPTSVPEKSSTEVMEKKPMPPNFDEDPSSRATMGNTRINMNSFRDRASVTSSNIHERRKNIDKMKAISLIKNKGGLAKSNPNQVKLDMEKRKSLKRRFEEEEDEASEDPKANKKSVLSQRFIDLMNARSKHEDLVDIAELIEQQNYFNKLEKKEQLEEKMLSTYKVPCKAVTCLKCKYKWFSASDLCRADGHPIKVIETYKRFFKCDNCQNRIISLEIIPLTNCKNCGSGKWARAPMIRDKIVKPESQLCIRGDEQKNLNSLSGSVNLNLLVPE